MRKTISLLLILVSPAAMASTFWQFVDEAVRNHPDFEVQKAEEDVQRARVRLSGFLEDPVVDIARVNRSNQGQRSEVESIALRQKLPIWSARARQKGSLAAQAQAAHQEANATRMQLENEIISKLYEYARAKEEQLHLRERRERLTVIKTALAQTKAASASHRIERSMIASAIQLTEDQFDTLDMEVADRKTELEKLGLGADAKITARWITKSDFTAFRKKLSSLSTRANPKIEAERERLAATRLRLQALSPRPDFDLILQTDQERGGAREKNFTVGLSATIPLGGISARAQAVGHAEVRKAEAEMTAQDRALAIKMTQLTHELALAEKSLDRFDYGKIEALEAQVQQAEKDVREGWVSVAQLLEFERQVHAQIESSFQAQIRAVHAIVSACNLYECDPRDHLKGQL